VADYAERPPDIEPVTFWIIVFRWQVLAVFLEVAAATYLALDQPGIGDSASDTFYVAIAGTLPILLLNFVLRVREMAEDIGEMNIRWRESRDHYREMINNLPTLKAGAEQSAPDDDDVWELIAHLEEEKASGEWDLAQRPNLRQLGRIAGWYVIEASALSVVGIGIALVVLAGAASTTLAVAVAGFAVFNLLLLLIVRELAELSVTASGGRAEIARANQ
jgi:hypothetical protein